MEVASGTYDEQASHTDDDTGHGWRRGLSIKCSDLVLHALEGQILSRSIAFKEVQTRMWRSSENAAK